MINLVQFLGVPHVILSLIKQIFPALFNWGVKRLKHRIPLFRHDPLLWLIISAKQIQLRLGVRSSCNGLHIFGFFNILGCLRSQLAKFYCLFSRMQSSHASNILDNLIRLGLRVQIEVLTKFLESILFLCLKLFGA